MRPLKILLSLLVPGTFSLLCTSNPQITGPSTELGNPVYIGVVLDTTLNPAQNANVTVFKMITVSNSNIAFDTIGIEIVSFITDTQGLFSIDNMVPGEYRIQSYTSDSSLFALKRVLIIDEQDSTMYDTLILGPSGSVKGVTTRRGQLASQSNAEINDGDIRLVITEINQTTITGPDGVFMFSNVPEGVYTLAIYPDNSFFSEIRKPIRVTSGTITPIDTIFLKRIPWVKPPKPNNLQCTYDTVSASVTLHWEPVQIQNLLGYIVERRFQESILEPQRIFIEDTTYVESMLTYQSGKQIFYSVRSITVQYEVSYPDGPVSIVVN